MGVRVVSGGCGSWVCVCGGGGGVWVMGARVFGGRLGGGVGNGRRGVWVTVAGVCG